MSCIGGNISRILATVTAQTTTMEDFSHRLQRLRKDRGMSQDHLAQASETSRNTIGKYERAEAQPSADVAVRLASILEVSVGELLGVEEPKTLDPEATARIEALTKLDPDTRKTLYQIIDTFLRDATARKAYSI